MTQKIKCTHVTGTLIMHVVTLQYRQTVLLDCKIYSVLDYTVMIKWLTTVPSPPTLESNSVWFSSCPSSRLSVLASQRDRLSGWHHHHILERAEKRTRTTHTTHTQMQAHTINTSLTSTVYLYYLHIINGNLKTYCIYSRQPHRVQVVCKPQQVVVMWTMTCVQAICGRKKKGTSRSS